jgi:PAP2 superfamily
VGWILASRWMPYQRPTFVTPAFPGYVSGHSTFSRAAAEVMSSFTGSRYFPGGLFESRVPRGSLDVERGPSRAVVIQAATYYDAADEAGVSRIYGGIHIPEDDFAGRRIGSVCGRKAMALARRYFDGSARP